MYPYSTQAFYRSLRSPRLEVTERFLLRSQTALRPFTTLFPLWLGHPQGGSYIYRIDFIHSLGSNSIHSIFPEQVCFATTFRIDTASIAISGQQNMRAGRPGVPCLFFPIQAYSEFQLKMPSSQCPLVCCALAPLDNENERTIIPTRCRSIRRRQESRKHICNESNLAGGSCRNQLE
jgi:hypothetical protein